MQDDTALVNHGEPRVLRVPNAQAAQWTGVVVEGGGKAASLEPKYRETPKSPGRTYDVSSRTVATISSFTFSVSRVRVKRVRVGKSGGKKKRVQAVCETRNRRTGPFWHAARVIVLLSLGRRKWMDKGKMSLRF
jgi:hypothetical protein